MREQDKIKEAEFFLREMEARLDNPVVYQYLTSAFLSAARSVLQYALDGVSTKDGGRKWYDARVAESTLLRFFTEKRNANVHRQEPVAPTRTRSVHREMPWLNDEDEWRLPPTILVERVTYHYSFDDWPGPSPNDVPTLCRQYLDELRRVVADGQAERFITS